MSVKLTTSSYVVLTLVERLQPATAYDLKQLARSTVFNFWALQHTVLYTETQRLCSAGLLRAEQEDHGRRRRLFSLTDTGLELLDDWRSEPPEEFFELRDPALLKLFAGAEPRRLAADQLPRHRAQLTAFEDVDRQLATDPADAPDALRSVLAAGIAFEREYVRFWTALAEHGAATVERRDEQGRG